MSTSPKMGRPKKDDTESKRKHIDVRLTDEEYRFIDTLSKRIGITKSELVLKAVHLLAEQNK